MENIIIVLIEEEQVQKMSQLDSQPVIFQQMCPKMKLEKLTEENVLYARKIIKEKTHYICVIYVMLDYV